MAKVIRANYIGTCPEPQPGCMGTAIQTDGFNDPRSVEYMAWAFQPDGDECLYYVGDDEIAQIHTRF